MFIFGSLYVYVCIYIYIYIYRRMLKMRRQRINPESDAIRYVRSSSDKRGLEIKFINSEKGRGVFAVEALERGDFVAEYRGQLIDRAESEKRRRVYHPSKLQIKKLAVDGMPHLCLFALRDILPGEEITYSYGDGPWPWRKQVRTVVFIYVFRISLGCCHL
uniref:SET domain-containing protein n=1 Tax=Erpetoichthys calabaricus TaxID=27687 RepID=A0A8C4X8D1_ERPCA